MFYCKFYISILTFWNFNTVHRLRLIELKTFQKNLEKFFWNKLKITNFKLLISHLMRSFFNAKQFKMEQMVFAFKNFFEKFLQRISIFICSHILQNLFCHLKCSKRNEMRRRRMDKLLTFFWQNSIYCSKEKKISQHFFFERQKNFKRRNTLNFKLFFSRNNIHLVVVAVFFSFELGIYKLTLNLIQ